MAVNIQIHFKEDFKVKTRHVDKPFQAAYEVITLRKELPAPETVDEVTLFMSQAGLRKLIDKLQAHAMALEFDRLAEEVPTTQKQEAAPRETASVGTD